jgi:hypothetical protein
VPRENFVLIESTQRHRLKIVKTFCDFKLCARPKSVLKRSLARQRLDLPPLTQAGVQHMEQFLLGMTSPGVGFCFSLHSAASCGQLDRQSSSLFVCVPCAATFCLLSQLTVVLPLFNERCNFPMFTVLSSNISLGASLRAKATNAS